MYHLITGHPNTNWHIVTDWELKKMEQDIKRQDLLSVYKMSIQEKSKQPLTYEQETQIIAALPSHIRSFLPKCNQNEIKVESQCLLGLLPPPNLLYGDLGPQGPI
jgi:hypothetical protein